MPANEPPFNSDGLTSCAARIRWRDRWHATLPGATDAE